ncbi:MAG: hypothetical protein QOI73_1630 [Solirubrobacteraceae bacterium]|nr:hypothetical protein [Solirubrobacteraceae bacterium]
MKVSRTYHPRALEAARLLGAQVRAARLRRRMTLAELAERVGTTPPTLRKVENGDPSVGLGVAFQAAVLCGVPLFAEDRTTVSGEIGRVEQMLTLLPRRARPIDDVDDDF